MYEYIQTPQGWVLHWGPLPDDGTQATTAVLEPAIPSTLMQLDAPARPVAPIKQPTSYTVELSC